MIIGFQAYLNKQGKSQVNNLTLQLKKPDRRTNKVQRQLKEENKKDQSGNK